MSRIRLAIVSCEEPHEFGSALLWRMIYGSSSSDYLVHMVQVGERSRLSDADAECISASSVVLFSGDAWLGRMDDDALFSRMAVRPERQLVGAQRSGVLCLAKLGLASQEVATPDPRTARVLQDMGVPLTPLAFVAHGNVATAAGPLASAALGVWCIWKTTGRSAAIANLEDLLPFDQSTLAWEVLRSVAPAINSSTLVSDISHSY